MLFRNFVINTSAVKSTNLYTSSYITVDGLWALSADVKNTPPVGASGRLVLVPMGDSRVLFFFHTRILA